jgi:endonuclease G, mitochondrial
MPVVPLVLGALSMLVPGRLWTQTLEARVRQLEQQVQQLRALHGLTTDTRTAEAVPEELAGNENTRWGYPGGNCMLLIKDFYFICHDNDDRIPVWVMYHLTPEDLAGGAERSDDFRADPALDPDDRAELADYRYSGYDRGHMAPAADFRQSDRAMSDTFVLSNMVPQRPNLNRRLWATLEDQVRQLAEAHGSIWVVTGELFLAADSTPTEPTDFIGPNQVAVPTHLYKMVLCQHPAGDVELFAFVLPNQLDPVPGVPADYLTTVDRIEALSGLDFFSVLPDDVEDRLERQLATAWPVH